MVHLKALKGHFMQAAMHLLVKSALGNTFCLWTAKAAFAMTQCRASSRCKDVSRKRAEQVFKLLLLLLQLKRSLKLSHKSQEVDKLDLPGQEYGSRCILAT
jgi:hypothetical protein